MAFYESTYFSTRQSHDVTDCVLPTLFAADNPLMTICGILVYNKKGSKTTVWSPKLIAVILICWLRGSLWSCGSLRSCCILLLACTEAWQVVRVGGRSLIVLHH